MMLMNRRRFGALLFRVGDFVSAIHQCPERSDLVRVT
jgi:hypothetical protein